MKKVLIILLLFCLFINGCGIVYQERADKLMSTAILSDYGPQPENYKDKIALFYSPKLKDPESARYTDWKGPYQRTIPDSSSSYNPMLCWAIDVSINAKNSFGGYVGAERYIFIFVNNEIYAYRHITGSFIFIGK